MATLAKVTSKGQTTIPREVREALNVKPGDVLAWDLRDGGRVEVRRVEPVDVEYRRTLEVALSEWASPEDDEAYRDL